MNEAFSDFMLFIGMKLGKFIHNFVNLNLLVHFFNLFVRTTHTCVHMYSTTQGYNISVHMQADCEVHKKHIVQDFRFGIVLIIILKLACVEIFCGKFRKQLLATVG